jgi:hypothetical protein
MALTRLRIVVFPETTKAWTARSLEHDIEAGGRTADAALDALVRVASAHIAFDIRHGRAPLSAFGPAPRPYWNAYGGASMIDKPREVLRMEPYGPFACSVTLTKEHPAIRPSRIA